VVRERVEAAVQRQEARLSGTSWYRNSQVPAGALDRLVALDDDVEDAWRTQATAHGMTGRGAARIRRVARTLADLDDAARVSVAHVLWAAMLREDVP